MSLSNAEMQIIHAGGDKLDEESNKLQNIVNFGEIEVSAPIRTPGNSNAGRTVIWDSGGRQPLSQDLMTQKLRTMEK